jgi:RNA polymerase sigma-70 factor, ECF subfamily
MDDDRELVGRARTGDYQAFEQLVARYEQRVFKVVLGIVRHREDAEEAVQETFLKVVEHLDGFREESGFYTWLMRIAVNEGLTLLRKRKRRPAVQFDEQHGDEGFDSLPHPEFIAQWRETPDELASRAETRELLGEAIGELSEKYRLVFVLRDVEGLSTAETAQALGIGEANVKVRLMRARLMLRERLTRVFGDEATRVEPGHDHG